MTLEVIMALPQQAQIAAEGAVPATSSLIDLTISPPCRLTADGWRCDRRMIVNHV